MSVQSSWPWKWLALGPLASLPARIRRFAPARMPAVPVRAINSNDNNVRPTATLHMMLAALAISCISALCSAQTDSSRQVRIPIKHELHRAALAFHQPASLTSDTRVMISRLEYLVTGVKLQRQDETWESFPDRHYHLNPLEQECAIILETTSTNSWKSVGFSVGVPATINHEDPAQWPAGHPLNVLECNLHWSWKAGYVFLALEGYSMERDKARKAFLYHVGNDPQLMKVELPLPKGARLNDCEVVLHVDRIWQGAYKIAPTDGGGVTHSSDNDMLAPRLARNVEKAFEVRVRARK